MKRVYVAAIAAAATTAAASEIKPIGGIDLLVGFRELAGQEVVVKDCLVAGTTPAFIRCEAPNDAGSYALRADSMNRDDLRWAFEICPTGNRKKPICRVTVRGTVEKSDSPWLIKASIVR